MSWKNNLKDSTKHHLQKEKDDLSCRWGDCPNQRWWHISFGQYKDMYTSEGPRRNHPLPVGPKTEVWKPCLLPSRWIQQNSCLIWLWKSILKMPWLITIFSAFCCCHCKLLFVLNKERMLHAYLVVCVYVALVRMPSHQQKGCNLQFQNITLQGCKHI